MKELADRIMEYVDWKASLPAGAGGVTEAELVDGLHSPRPFIREALLVLAPADPEAKAPSPRAGCLAVDERGVWRRGRPPPAPPEPEPVPCSMTADGGHIPSPNPLYLTGCVACGHEIGPTDPVRKGYARPVASVRSAR